MKGEKLENLLTEYRKAKGLTQKELALQVKVTPRTIISIEKGKYKPSLILAYKLAQVFNTSIEHLFMLSEYIDNMGGKQ